MVGIIYLVCGAFMYKIPPGKINYIMGYRTRRSMKDQTSWDFAQKYSGKLMIYAGIISMAMGFSVWMLYPDDALIACIVMILQILAVIPVITVTEGKIKRMQQ
jgi:uncharacterized membrane protein